MSIADDECLHVAEPGGRNEDEGCSCVEDYPECAACDGDPDAVCVWFQRPAVLDRLGPPPKPTQHSNACPEWCACWSQRIAAIEWARDYRGEPA